MTSNAQLQYEEFGIVVVPSEQGLQARISSVDQMLSRIDGILIDPRCTRLINGFIGGYVYPEKVGSQNEFLQSPIKNQFSHVHDALQYLCAKLFSTPKRQEQEMTMRNLYTMDKIREMVAESNEEEYDPKRYGGSW